MRAAALAILCATLLVAPAQAVLVKAVHDGDTFTIAGDQRIRVEGIDAPELKQPFGYQSRDYMRGLILNKDVTLNCTGKSYKRKVCNVYLKGVDVAGQLVRAGLAWDAPKYSKRAYQEPQEEAQQKRVGLWSQPGQEAPWIWRQEQRHKD